MTKIYYDEINIENQCKNRLENAINFVNNAYQNSSNLNVPRKFKYRSYTKSVDDSIKQSLVKIQEVYNTLNLSKTIYSNINNDTNNRLTNMGNCKIQRRTSAIK